MKKKPALHIDKSIEAVRTYIRVKGIAPSRLALDVGLSINSLRGVHGPKWSPEAKTLRKLERHIRW